MNKTTSRAASWPLFLSLATSALMALPLGCGSGGVSAPADPIDASGNPYDGYAVGDDMVYALDFRDDCRELRQAAEEDSASFWLEEWDGATHPLRQVANSEGRVLLRIDGVEAGTYRLMMSTKGKDDRFLLDWVFDVQPPAALGFEGGVLPGATITARGYFYGKTPSVSLEYKESQDGEYVRVPCSLRSTPGGYDDPYDRSDERFPMDVNTGDSSVRAVLPQTESNTWYSPRLVIQSDSGAATLILADKVEGSSAMAANEGAPAPWMKTEGKRGDLVSFSNRGCYDAHSHFGAEITGNLVDAISGGGVWGTIKGATVVYPILVGVGFSGSDLVYDVHVYNVLYLTQDPFGASVLASGVVLLPTKPGGEAYGNAPVLSFQHGTMLMKKEAPTMSMSVELAMAMYLSSAGGYITAIADYPGLGLAALDKESVHPYCLAKPLAYSAVDMIRAAESVARSEASSPRPSPDLFLAGYSEGGYATMALLRELGERPISNVSGDKYAIDAVAAMAGPYSLSGVMRGVILKDEPFPVFYFAPYLLVSWNRYMGWGYKPGHIFLPPYVGAYYLIDGEHSPEEVDRYKPASGRPKDIMDRYILRPLEGGFGTYYQEMLKNDLDSGWSWDASIPVSLIHGWNDDCVPYENSELMARNHPEAKLIKLDLPSMMYMSDEPRHVLYYIFAMRTGLDWLNAKKAAK